LDAGTLPEAAKAAPGHFTNSDLPAARRAKTVPAAMNDD
jgi:hypothetical protein